MNKIMLITGANKGIGFHMVSEWLKRGNTAIVFDLACNEVDQLKTQYPGRLKTLVCDVSDYFTVVKRIEEIKEEFKTIDIAVHNACICIFKNIEQHSIDEYRNVMDVNFIGAVNLTKAILPIMNKRKGSRICFTSSGVGVTGYQSISGYAASKGAIEAFARCMRLENMDSDITFHILHPPLTNTESSSPLPVPKEFKADPMKVGIGLIRNINKKKFIIVPSLFDRFSIWMSYRFPYFTGKLLVKMTRKSTLQKIEGA